MVQWLQIPAVDGGALAATTLPTHAHGRLHRRWPVDGGPPAATMVHIHAPRSTAQALGRRRRGRRRDHTRPPVDRTGAGPSTAGPSQGPHAPPRSTAQVLSRRRRGRRRDHTPPGRPHRCWAVDGGGRWSSGYRSRLSTTTGHSCRLSTAEQLRTNAVAARSIVVDGGAAAHKRGYCEIPRCRRRSGCAQTRLLRDPSLSTAERLRTNAVAARSLVVNGGQTRLLRDPSLSTAEQLRTNAVTVRSLVVDGAVAVRSTARLSTPEWLCGQGWGTEPAQGPRARAGVACA